MIVTVGIDKTSLVFLGQAGFAVEKTNPEDFDVMDWARDTASFGAVIVNLDKCSGPYLCRGLRREGCTLPVIGVASEPAEGNWSEFRATFLENGGDDLLRIPLNPREMVASLRAALRRFQGSLLDIYTYQIGDMTLKAALANNTVEINGKLVYLTVSEANLLKPLVMANGRTLSKEMLMNSLYSHVGGREPDLKIIDVFICNARHACSKVHPGAEKFIETVWGRGYRMAGSSQELKVIAA